MLLPEFVDGFFMYAKERQSILLKRRAGKPKPWTSDKILQTYRFCNIYREDDVVTEWVRDHIRARYSNGDLIFNLIAARLFNLPSTLQRLLDAGVLDHWDKERAKAALKGITGPTVNAAYIVIGQTGFNKGDGICETLDKIYPYRHRLYEDIKRQNTLEAATEEIASFDRMGYFLGYEVACDLRYTPILENATDVNTWANPGPGAARGLSRMCGQEKGYFNRGSKQDKLQMNVLMVRLLQESRHRWPRGWKRWEMREVEHTLCEYDKYLRVLNGEGRPKQRYNGS